MNEEYNKPLTPDEAAITDYLSGVLKNVPPPVAPASEDRARLEELMQLRNEISEAAIATPDMTTTFNDVIRRAGKPGVVGSLLDAMSSRWGFRLTAAAAVFVVFVSGLVISAKLGSGGVAFNGVAQVEQYPTAEARRNGPNPNNLPPADMSSSRGHDEASLREPLTITLNKDVPPTYTGTFSTPESTPVGNKNIWANTMIRRGSLGLRHENPADIQRKILDELTMYGGLIINLNRNGVGENTAIGMELSVPSEKFAKFVVAVSAFGEVISQSESAQDAVGEIVDNEAALAEAKDYLKRLDTLAEKAPASLSEAQNLEAERRRARYDIERYTRALDKLKERTSMATLNVSISTKRPEIAVVAPASPFQKAVNDGLDGLTKFAAGLLQIFLVTLPLSIPLMIFLVVLLRRRRKVPYGQ
ncbi:MAG: DUF4349 domain-containing protein [Planctomycetes bacterium]|nr:DUF4349 domain-containing protein [Planctomycetota bacterium]